MASKTSLTKAVISRAESYDGIQAGIVPLKKVLKGRSYRAAAQGEGSRNSTRFDDVPLDSWPAAARTVLILGLNHPEETPRLDYWERGDTWGNRRLREISELLKRWLMEKYDIAAYPLPYHVEKGGLFLKDAAVLSGIGIVGRNNLLLHPKWGPRIRLRSILLTGEFQSTEAREDFGPCETCEGFCQKACPKEAFPQGEYDWAICFKQIRADVENKVPAGEIGENGKRNSVIKYCRACELACPVGA